MSNLYRDLVARTLGENAARYFVDLTADQQQYWDAENAVLLAQLDRDDELERQRREHERMWRGIA
jgi:hypothetical protein